MKIGRVKVSNFRSIREVDFPVGFGVTGLIGGNESGKSNILLAIKNFLSQEKIPHDDRYQLSDDDIQITITFNKLSNSEKDAIKTLLKTEEDIDSLVIRRTYDEYELLNPVMPNASEQNIPDTHAKSSDSKEITTSVPEVDNKLGSTDNQAVEESEPQQINNTAVVPVPSQEEISTDIPPKQLTKAEILQKILALLPRAQYINSIEELISGNNIPIIELLPLDKPSKNLKSISQYKADALKKLLLLGNITEEDLRLSDIGRKNMILNKKAGVIAKKLRSSWTHEDIKIRMFAGRSTLTINFRDGRNIPTEPPKEREDDSRWIWTLPENRSVGFRWYVTFYTKFLYGQSEADSVIYLIDDAGAPLNKIAQEDLLREFNNIASENTNNQIFYSTHSKYMVGWDYKENILLIDKQAGLGTSATPKWWVTVDKKHWPAPLSEIGAESHDFLKPSNLITEGLTDAMVLERVSFVLKENGLSESPFSDYHLLPSNGIPSMLKLGEISKAEGKKEYLLFDADQTGLDGKAGALGKLLYSNDLGTLANNAQGDYKIITIEDLLPQNTFLQSTNTAGRQMFNERWEDIVRFNDTPSGILEAIKTRLIAKGFSELEVSQFFKEKKYDVVLDTLQKVSNPQDYRSTSQVDAIIRLFNGLSSDLNPTG